MDCNHAALGLHFTAMDTLKTLQQVLGAMTQAQRKAIGHKAGVPFETAQKIAIGATKNPRFETVEKLKRVLLDD